MAGIDRDAAPNVGLGGVWKTGVGEGRKRASKKSSKLSNKEDHKGTEKK